VALDGGLLRVFEGRWWVEAAAPHEAGGGGAASTAFCEQWVRLAVAPPSPLRAAFRGALAKKAASSLGEQKAKAVIATGAEVVVSGNIGCLTQLQLHLKKLGSSIEVKHTMQVLRDSLPSDL
jgi:hypothetical protein